MPGTAVGIGLKALEALSGLGSKVSMWLAPPVMKSRMQLLCLGRPADCSAARAARVLSQPEAGRPRAPAEASLSQSRRERPLRIADCGLRINESNIASPSRRIALRSGRLFSNPQSEIRNPQSG
jgi:hypothetical protein